MMFESQGVEQAYGGGSVKGKFIKFGIPNLSESHPIVKKQGKVPGQGKKQAKQFLKKDHHDENMLVAIRIRPLNNAENAKGESEIIRTEDKLLVSKFNLFFIILSYQVVLDRVEMECENAGTKPDVLHRSREQRYFFDRIFNHNKTT